MLRCLSHKARKWVHRFDLQGAWPRTKVRTGQHWGQSMGHSKKSQSGRNISVHLLGRSSHCTDWNQNHVCKVSRWYLQGLRIYDLRFHLARISHFPIDFCMGLTRMQRYCTACNSRLKPKMVENLWLETPCTRLAAPFCAVVGRGNGGMLLTLPK